MKLGAYEFSPEVIAKAQEIFDCAQPRTITSAERPFALWRAETQAYFAHLATRALEQEGGDGL